MTRPIDEAFAVPGEIEGTIYEPGICIRWNGGRVMLDGLFDAALLRRIADHMDPPKLTTPSDSAAIRLECIKVAAAAGRSVTLWGAGETIQIADLYASFAAHGVVPPPPKPSGQNLRATADEPGDA